MPSAIKYLAGSSNFGGNLRPRHARTVSTGQVDALVKGSSVVRAFTETFDSASVPSLWKPTTGSWSTSSGRVVTSTAASSYPILAFTSGTLKATLRAEYGTASARGYGVSFWVKDSSNWWAAVVNMTSYSCQIGTTSGCCACGSDQCGPDGGCTCYNCSTGAPIANAGGCSYPVFGTCYTYTLRLLRSLSGSVTEIGSANLHAGNIGASLTPAYVQVVLNSSGQITATSALISGGSTATVTSTPSNPIKSTRHGIIMAPVTTGTQALDVGTFIYAPA